MKRLSPIIAVLLLASCANLSPNQKALITSAETIASVAATAAATYFGGPAAGQLASAGLSALATVMQGYVGTTVPTAVVQNSPGITGVGDAVVAILPPRPVTQQTVDTVNKAAAIAATLKASNIIPITPVVAPSAPKPTATP